jgi:hypothetical protein
MSIATARQDRNKGIKGNITLKKWGLLLFLVSVLVAGATLIFLPHIPDLKPHSEYFEMGQYYKVHMYDISYDTVNRIKVDRDQNERAWGLGGLQLPMNIGKKKEMSALFTRLAMLAAKERNRCVDSFVQGFESK